MGHKRVIATLQGEKKKKYPYIYIHMYVYIHIHIYVYVYVYTYIYTYIHMYVYIYGYIYMDICSFCPPVRERSHIYKGLYMRWSGVPAPECSGSSKKDTIQEIS